MLEIYLSLEIFSHNQCHFKNILYAGHHVLGLKAWLSLRVLPITTSEIIIEILLGQILPKWIVIGNLILKTTCQNSPDIEETLISYRNKSEVTLDSTKCLLPSLFSQEQVICIIGRSFRLRKQRLCGFYNFINKRQRRACLCGFVPWNVWTSGRELYSRRLAPANSDDLSYFNTT